MRRHKRKQRWWRVVTSGDSPGDRWQMLRFPREVVGPQRLVEFVHRDVLGVVFLVMAFDSQWPWHGVPPPREVTSASDIELYLLARHGSESEIIWIFADLQEGWVKLGVDVFSLTNPWNPTLALHVKARQSFGTHGEYHRTHCPPKPAARKTIPGWCSLIRFFTSHLKSQAQFPIQAPSGKLLLPLVEVQLCSAQVSRTPCWSWWRINLSYLELPALKCAKFSAPLVRWSKMDKCWVSLSRAKPSQGKFMEPGCRFGGCQKICQEISI